jgi:peptidoglycan hydrolase CwlO-like protein
MKKTTKIIIGLFVLISAGVAVFFLLVKQSTSPTPLLSNDSSFTTSTQEVEELKKEIEPIKSRITALEECFEDIN